MMTQTLHKTYRLAVAMAAVTVLTPVLPVSAQVTYTTRALTGDHAPGTGAGVIFSHFRYLVLNDAGQIAFKGTLRGKGVDDYKHTNDTGIWSDRSGSLKLVVRTGDAAPGTEGVFHGISGPSLNDAGQITISGTARVNRTNHRYKNIAGIWADKSGSLRLVAHTGGAAPGTGRVFNSLGLPLILNDAGQTAFSATIPGKGTRHIPGIWSEGSGSLKLVARAGNAAPGTAEGAMFRTVGGPFLLNSTGQLAFSGTIRGSDHNDITGIWSEQSGSLKLVALFARRGDAVPGTEGVFRIVDNFVLNGAGQFAFLGRFKGTGVDSRKHPNDAGIWSNRSGSLKLIVRKGDAAPGTEGVFYGISGPSLNDAGQTAFLGKISLEGSSGHVVNIAGIWSEGSGSLKLVALGGDAAPGTPEGVVFGSFGFGDLVLNGAGQTAFLGSIRIKGDSSPNGDLTGVWATAPNGQLMLIAREGDLFDVNDDPLIEDLRTIREVRFSSFNDAGQLAFELDFTDGGGSGIFVATIADSPTAVVTPIETTQQRNTHATENQTTQDDAPITQSQQPQAGSSQSKEDRPEKATPALPVSAAVTYDTRALSGDVATGPDTGEGVMFTDFHGFVLNDAGQLVFASSGGSSPRNNYGIWSDRSGSLKLVARSGDTAPGTAEGTVFKRLDQPAINDTGQIAFRGGTEVMRKGSPWTGWGIWSEEAGSLKLVARAGDAAPGTDKRFRSFHAPVVINNAGQITFGGATTKTPGRRGSIRGIWSDRSGSLKLVARGGSKSTGTEIVFSTSYHPVINNAGQIAFIGRTEVLRKGYLRTAWGIWSDRSGSLKLVARTGDPAPGTAPGVVYNRFGDPVINDAGQIVFFVRTETEVMRNGGRRTAWGIWSDRSGPVKRVVYEGDAAPGTDGVFAGFVGDLVINGAGQIAFGGTVRATDKLGRTVYITGIWSEGSGSLKLVALVGDRLPGKGEGVVFRGFFGLVLNGAGQIAFRGRFDLNPYGSGIWATAPNGQLMLIAQEGDLFDINDDPLIDDLRKVYGLIDGGGEHMQLSFNDAGQLAFYLPFSNGKGLFVATIADSPTAVVTPIETTQQRNTHATENQTTQDDAPITQSQQPQAGSSQSNVERPEITTPALPVSTQVTYDTRALSGDVATGPDTDLGVPMINGAGQIAFRTKEGIWSDTSGSLKLVAREGDAAPGTRDGANFDSFGIVLAFNDAGQTAFGANLKKGKGGVYPKSGSRRSLWSEGSGSLKLVARAGDPAPGTDGVFISFSNPVLNGAGQIAFRGTVRATDKLGRTGIWSEGSGSLKLVARAGDPAPGTAPGVVFSGFGVPVINNAGQITFGGATTKTSDGRGRIPGIWSDRSGSLKLVARTGDPAPGTAPGVVYKRFDDPVINDAGQIVFRGLVSVGDAGIWSEGSGSLKLVSRVDGSGISVLMLNGAGQIAFRTKEGIWLDTSGSLKQVVRQYGPAPGTAPGVGFRDFGDPVLNGAGQIAFRGTITGRGNSNTGIWATDANGVLTLIARTGDRFDVNDDPLIDDLRTIASVNLLTRGGGGGEDGRATSFNDAGQLAFYLTFTDGPNHLLDNDEGLFVATLPNSPTAVMDPIQTKPLLESDAARK